MRQTFALLLMVLLLPACSPLGVVISTGAALGVAAAREGGIPSTVSDFKIKAAINDLWFKYDLETFAKLNLTINQGRVLITGVVQDPESRVEAVRLAWQAENVLQVMNEIRVAEGEGFPGYVRDQWIATRLRTALTFDREVQSVNYSIDTVQGTVYLMGVAQNQAELDHVIDVARRLPQVKQVISYVKQAGEEITFPQTGLQETPGNENWLQP